MSTKLAFVPCLAAVCLAAFSISVTAQEQQMPDLGKMFQAMMGAAAQGEDAAPVELVNFRDLKALLPAELSGMKRVEASGEKSGAMGMTVSTAKAIYKHEDGGQITIELSDLGGTGGLAGLAAMGFETAEIDRETETGYERTTKFDGFPGKEEYDSKMERGEISAFVGRRVSAKVEAYKVSDEVMHEAFEAIDLKKISELVEKAVEDAKAGEAAEEPADEKAE